VSWFTLTHAPATLTETYAYRYVTRPTTLTIAAGSLDGDARTGDVLTLVPVGAILVARHSLGFFDCTLFDIAYVRHGTVNTTYEFHNYIGIIETRRRIWLN
jgi:hypothetical protein